MSARLHDELTHGATALMSARLHDELTHSATALMSARLRDEPTHSPSPCTVGSSQSNEAWRPKHGARSIAPEARRPKHGARSTAPEARRPKHGPSSIKEDPPPRRWLWGEASRAQQHQGGSATSARLG